MTVTLAVGAAGITTSTWYDNLDRVVMTKAADGEIVKTAYTSFGAVAATYRHFP